MTNIKSPTTSIRQGVGMVTVLLTWLSTYRDLTLPGHLGILKWDHMTWAIRMPNDILPLHILHSNP